MTAIANGSDSRFVFIVGIARTGSKIYMTNLNRYSDIDIVNELHYLAPRYIRRDFIATVQDTLGNRLRALSAEALVELMYSGALLGTFWERKRRTAELQHRLIDLDPAVLVRRLKEAPPSWPLILRILLDEHARVAGKARPGAKFPVDISQVETLMRWFPGARFVHLIRDPRAIYASMVARELRYSSASDASTAAIAGRRLGYLLLQYRRAANLHRRYAGTGRYYLSRFEDVVGDAGRSIPALCAFLGIDVVTGMFRPPGKDSSFRDSGRAGLDSAAMTAWRDYLGRGQCALIELLLGKEMRLFGYGRTSPGSIKGANLQSVRDVNDGW